MMSSLDYFEGILRCPVCGELSLGGSTNMQTKLSKHPSLREIVVGDLLDADWCEVCSAGYFEIAKPKQLDTITILETWVCPSCKSPFNWAKIEIVNGKVELIESVKLSAKIIQSANYITEDCCFLLDDPDQPDLKGNSLVKQLVKLTEESQEP